MQEASLSVMYESHRNDEEQKKSGYAFCNKSVSEEMLSLKKIRTDERQKTISLRISSAPSAIFDPTCIETPFENKIRTVGRRKSSKILHLHRCVGKDKIMDIGKKEQVPQIPVRVVYYKSRHFQHFHYIYELAKKCRYREELVEKSPIESALQGDIIIKISFIGNVTDDNLRLISKRKGGTTINSRLNDISKLERSNDLLQYLYEGKRELTGNREIWEASPIVCFEDGNYRDSVAKLSCVEEVCHKILIRTNAAGENQDFQENNIMIVDQDHIRQAITVCLEEPLRRLFSERIKELKSEHKTQRTLEHIREMENVIKQMSLKETKTVSTSGTSNIGYTCIVPKNVKEYLCRRDDIASFGVWQNATFKVFTRRRIDQRRKLYHELRKLNQDFVEKYRLEIEMKKLVAKLTMTQGDYIYREQDGIFFGGTLGGFVTKTDESGKTYALTCNHVFPLENLAAYADNALHSNQIGKCVFTTREQSSDFAAIEMNDSADCDVTFRREDNIPTNARVFEGHLNEFGLVHKIGAKSGVTTGSILSFEHYEKSTDNENCDLMFLVRGEFGELFSEEGDSGSLVFSRPLEVDQNHVNVIGMLYGTYESREEEFKDENASCSPCVSSKSANCDVSCSDITSQTSQALAVNDVPKNISSCFRIHPVLDLFQKNQGATVTFKDDLSSSQEFPLSSPEDSS